MESSKSEHNVRTRENRKGSKARGMRGGFRWWGEGGDGVDYYVDR